MRTILTIFCSLLISSSLLGKKGKAMPDETDRKYTLTGKVVYSKNKPMDYSNLEVFKQVTRLLSHEE